MSELKKQVYIVGHKMDEDVAIDIAQKLEDAGIRSSIFSQQKHDEVEESALNCDAVVVIQSKHLKNDDSMDRILNLLTAKKAVGYISDDTVFNDDDSIMYFLEKTRKFDATKDNVGFIDAVDNLLGSVKPVKDVLIVTDEAHADAAKKMVSRMATDGLSSAVYPHHSDLQEPLQYCQAVVIVGIDTKADVLAKIKSEAGKHHKKVIADAAQHMHSDKSFEKFAVKTAKLIIKNKPPFRDIQVENTGNVKLIKKTWAQVLCAIVFTQVFVFVLWLTSKHSIFFAPLLLAVIAVYVFILAYYKKRCAIKCCSKKHNGKKVKVNIKNSNKTHVYRLCIDHVYSDEISAGSQTNRLMPAVVAVVTVGFALFLIVAGVKASDFTFLDLRERIAAAQQAEFADAGFEALVRNSFDLGDDPISCGTLAEKTQLNIKPKDMVQQISSLDDLKYFPELTVFDCGDVREISGDFSSFSYTPKLENLNIGSSEIGGDIAPLGELVHLNSINKGFRDDENEVQTPIFGDISAFINTKDLHSLLLPDTGITGDIAALQGLDLYEVDLRASDVYGDISAFVNMNNIYRIHMSYTNITGDISTIERLSTLAVIDMAQTDVTGDIHVFSGMNMDGVNLSETDVYGDIAVFENMTDINSFQFSFCNGITGDLSALRNLSSLYTLELNATAIGGDIDALSELNNLQVCYLFQTQVSGDIAVFAGKHRLIQLNMVDCDVLGDINVFSDKQKLEMLMVSNTNVSGELTALDNLPNLTTLEITGTNITDAEGNIVGKTLSALGFDQQGSYNDEEAGVSIRIESMALNGASEDAFIYSLNMRGKPFDVRITFPGRKHEITFDGKTYEYLPVEFEVIDPGFDVEAALSDYIGGDASGIHEEIVCGIENYCAGTFGFNVDDLMAMNYGADGNAGETNESSAVWNANGIDADPMNVVATVLNDPQVIFSEDAAAIDSNVGGNFGNVAIKQLGEDGSYYQFISNDDGAYMIGNINFLDLGDFRGNAQAVLIKFQPEDVSGLSFTLFGNGEIVLQFENNLPHLVVVQDFFKASYADYLPTDLSLQSDKWYWALMAFDENGNYRSLVWEDGNAEQAAYCAENFGDWHPEYKESNWHLTIGFGSNETLNVMEYHILDFDGLNLAE